jgi:peptidyl-tRNA hydrolase
VADWRAVRAEALSGRAVAVRDAGFTEVAPGTVTCVARWPTGG